MGEKIFFVYAWGWGIAALVENYVYLTEEGFMAWLLFGEVIACFRALLWPINLYGALMG